MALFTYSNLLKLGRLFMENPIISFTILLGALIFLWYSSRQKYFKQLGIPHEVPTMLFGHMMQPMYGSVSFAERIKIHYKKDTISRYMGFYDFNNPIILIRSPELAKQVTLTCFSHFTNHHGCVKSINDPLYSNNLFSLLHGEKWRDIRHRLTQALTPSNMKIMFELIVKCSKNFTEHMVERSQKNSITINSMEAFGRYVNDVMASCAFGVDVDSIKNPNNTFYIMTKKALTFKGLKLLRFLFIRSFPKISNLLNLSITSKHEADFFNRTILDTITVRFAHGSSRPDMVQLMMKTKKDPKSPGPDLSIKEMVAQAFVFFASGFDSTTSLICYVTYLISMNLEEQEKLRNEVDQVYKKFKGEPTYEAIDKMKYLDAVINETLRMYPITPYVERICTKRVVFPPAVPGGRHINIYPGSRVWIPTYALQNDVTYYPFATKFCPERFIKNQKQIDSSFTYIPFGHGPRMCIGNKFALLVTKVLVYHLVAKCLLNRSDQMILPLQLDPWSFSMAPKGGFRLGLESRWYDKIN